MSKPFAIYCRSSEENGDGFSSPPEEQEAEALAWAERAGVEVESEPVFEVVSGGVAAADRMLGQLIDRCEAGELAGIIVRDLNRFARDVVAGGAALARLVECGARLIATRNGFDSERITPETEMTFNMLMAVGQAERKRNRLRRVGGKRKAAERGVWCAATPVGYDRDDEGRLHPNADADAVRTVFALRAEGMGFSEITRRLPEVTVTHTRTRSRERVRLARSGVRRIVLNRAYLGEQRIPRDSGEPQVIENSHRPLVTEAEWEAANAVKGQGPRHTGLASEVAGLHGLVRCGGCGGKLHVLDREAPRYCCTAGTCSGRGSMGVYQLENAVDAVLAEAIKAGRPELLAAAESGEEYEVALAAVERATAALAEYRDSTELQQVLGMRDWTEGLKVRREAVDVARQALRRQGPRPRAVTDVRKLIRESSRNFISEVRVYTRSADHRLTVRWIGAEKAEPVITSPKEKAA